MTPGFIKAMEELEKNVESMEALGKMLMEHRDRGDETAHAFLLVLVNRLNTVGSQIESKAWRVRELQKKCAESASRSPCEHEYDVPTGETLLRCVVCNKLKED
jgi:hypothetical protein